MNVVGAEFKNTKESSQTQEQEIDLYIGIFFDGTNNNKYQVMLGKLFRRKQILAEIVASANNGEFSDEQLNYLLSSKILKRHTQVRVSPGTYTPYQIIIYEANITPGQLTKDYNWEIGKRKNNCVGILSKSQLDQLFFGYKGVGEGKDSFFMENLMLSQLRDSGEGKQNRKLSSISDERGTASISVASEQNVDEIDDTSIDDSLEGDFSQGATYTNVALMEGLYNTQNANHYSIYVEGSGSNMEIYPQFKDRELYAWMIRTGVSFTHPAFNNPMFDVVTTPLSLWAVDKMAGAANIMTKVGGLAFGCTDSGVLGKTRKASKLLQKIIDGHKGKNLKIHFDLFGFSRGATAARAFNYAINAKDDNVNEDDFRMIMGGDNFLLKTKITDKEVRFLGIFDTVSSIGVANNNGVLENCIADVLRSGCESCKEFNKSPFHEDNVKDYGLYATDQAEDVLHICAIDEYRQNFALVDIQKSIDNENGLELFLPGCHTDIGGGISLGREETYVVNIGSVYGVPNYLCDREPFSRDSMRYIPISQDTMIKLGWLKKEQMTKDKTMFRGRASSDSLSKSDDTIFSENSNTFWHRNNIIMNRYVMPGYSNISLALMVKRGNQNAKDMFHGIPLNYSVPPKLAESDYDNYFTNIENLINNKTGRFFVYPNTGLYKKLRSNYLHYSSNDQIASKANNLLVNPPAYLKVHYDKDSTTISGKYIDIINNSLPNLNESILFSLGNSIAPGFMSIAYKAASTLENLFSGTKTVRLATRVIYPGHPEKPFDYKFLFNYMPTGNSIVRFGLDSEEDEREKEEKYRLVLTDAYWEKEDLLMQKESGEKVKIRFIPYDKKVELFLDFIFEKDPTGCPKENVIFELKFEAPDYRYVPNSITVFGKDVLESPSVMPEHYKYSLKNFSLDQLFHINS